MDMWTIPPYSVHFYGTVAGSGGLDKRTSLWVRYKSKGLNQVGYSSVQEQQQYQQQQPTDHQNDFHWNEHDEQGKLSDSFHFYGVIFGHSMQLFSLKELEQPYLSMQH